MNLRRVLRVLILCEAGLGLIGMISYGLSKRYVRSGPTEAIVGASLIVTGLIFGLIYFSDLRHVFNRAATHTPGDAA